MHQNNKKNIVNSEKDKISLLSLRKDHQNIEREIKEIETIISEDEINRPNFIHVFNKLCNLWDNHEQKEKKLLSQKKNFEFSYLPLSDKNLVGHKKVLQLAAKSGSEIQLKVALENDGKMLINKLRSEIKKDNMFFGKLSINKGLKIG